MNASKKCLMIIVTMAFVGAFLCGNGCSKSDKESRGDKKTASDAGNVPAAFDFSGDGNWL